MIALSSGTFPIEFSHILIDISNNILTLLRILQIHFQSLFNNIGHFLQDGKLMLTLSLNLYVVQMPPEIRVVDNTCVKVGIGHLREIVQTTILITI